VGGGGGSKGGGGSGPSGVADTPLPPRKQEDVPEARANRAPRVQGAIQLPDAVTCRSTTISLALLLAGASDPDGDALSIINLRASTGTIERTAEGFVYTPAEHQLGPVVLFYEISDGTDTVAQVARFDVVRAPPIMGSEGDDVLFGGACDDEIDALGGDDDVSAGSGNDLVRARAGNDIIDAGAGDDIVEAGAGNDIVYAGAGDDIVFGGAGNDVIFGGAGADRLYGGDGDDVIDGGADGDMVLAGGGDDMVIGGAGHDMLQGGEGRDIVFGGDGDDDISGDAGADILVDGWGEDSVRGAAGDDVVLASADGANDVFDGGEGQDVLSYAESAQGLRIDAGAGRAEGDAIGADAFAAFEEIIAGSGDDVLDAGSTSVTLRGGAGNDHLSDGLGVNTIDGEQGDDIVTVADDTKPDVFVGGAGFDTLSFAGQSKDVFIDAADGLTSLDGVTFDRFSDFEKIIGGSGDDDIVAGGALEVMAGGKGDDSFVFGDRAAEAAKNIADRVYEILDLEAGDRLLVREFEIRTSGRDKERDVSDDPFEQAYGGGDRRPFQFRTERRDDGEYTCVDVYEQAESDDPAVVVYTIDVHGNHHLYTIVAA
jgi:Ca2+-binding RTX toxin-like protein